MATPIQAGQSNTFANLKCQASTLICREKTVILGDVTIGGECVIHPTTQILAKNGPIIIGNNNLIEERVNIINNRTEPMIIGDYNVFEVDSYCEAIKVGNNNIMESKSHLGQNIQLTDNCVIGAGCNLAKLEGQGINEEVNVFPPNTVISGAELTRRIVPNLPASSHSSQLDFLRKILPNYQKLWRPANLASTPQMK